MPSKPKKRGRGSANTKATEKQRLYVEALARRNGVAVPDPLTHRTASAFIDRYRNLGGGELTLDAMARIIACEECGAKPGQYCEEREDHERRGVAHLVRYRTAVELAKRREPFR